MVLVDLRGRGADRRRRRGRARGGGHPREPQRDPVRPGDARSARAGSASARPARSRSGACARRRCAEIAALIDAALRAAAGPRPSGAIAAHPLAGRRPGRAGSPGTRAAAATSSQAMVGSLAMTPTHRPPLAERVLAERVRTVPPSGIRKFFDILATMTDVISLGIGEPDFDTPRSIIEAGVESLREGRTHYTSNYGTLELRKALAAHLERLYGVEYDPKRELLITVGASEARRPRAAGHVRPGRRGHPPRAVVRRVRARRSCSRAAPSVHVATRFEDDFALDPAAVEAAITPRTKALFLGYPCNPTGAVLPDAVQERARPDRGAPRPARLQRRDLRPPRVRHVPPPRVLGAARGCASGRSSWAASRRPTR